MEEQSGGDDGPATVDQDEALADALDAWSDGSMDEEEMPQAPTKSGDSTELAEDTEQQQQQMVTQPVKEKEEPAAAAAAAAAGPEVPDMRRRIMGAMTEEQLNRYESYRRSSLPKAKMKKLLSQVLGTVNDRTVIAVCGVSKVFVGELVEAARLLAAQEGHAGPLLPRHIHRAYQNLKFLDPAGVPGKRLFRV